MNWTGRAEYVRDGGKYIERGKLILQAIKTKSFIVS